MGRVALLNLLFCEKMSHEYEEPIAERDRISVQFYLINDAQNCEENYHKTFGNHAMYID